MSIDIEGFASLFFLATSLGIAITALIRGPRIFKIMQWPILARISLIAILCIQLLWSVAALTRIGPHTSPAWLVLLFAITWWAGIVHVWRKRLSTDKPLFHVPPVGTIHPMQKSVAPKENTEA